MFLYSFQYTQKAKLCQYSTPVSSFWNILFICSLFLVFSILYFTTCWLFTMIFLVFWFVALFYFYHFNQNTRFGAFLHFNQNAQCSVFSVYKEPVDRSQTIQSVQKYRISRINNCSWGKLRWGLSTSLHSSARRGSNSTYWFLYRNLKITLLNFSTHI